MIEPVVWGIDPSSKRCALGVRHGDQARAYNLPLSGAVGAQRLGESFRLLTDWLAVRTAENAPECVFVEMPWGNPGHGKGVKELQQMLGVTLAALHIALDPAPPITMLEPSTWKMESGVGGGAGKAKVLRWAREELGYPGACPKCEPGVDKCDAKVPAHDEADALGIATAGLRIYSRRTLFEAAA